MRTTLENGKSHAFLNDRTLSAHPEEQEYLLGKSYWEVKKIQDMKARFCGQKFRVTVIFIEDPCVMD